MPGKTPNHTATPQETNQGAEAWPLPLLHTKAAGWPQGLKAWLSARKLGYNGSQEPASYLLFTQSPLTLAGFPTETGPWLIPLRQD